MAETPASTLAIEATGSPVTVAPRPSLLRAVVSDRGGMLALAFLALLALLALLAPLIARHGPGDILDAVTLKSLPPSREYWFGTDPVSRDVFSRMLHGARVSLRVALLSALLAGTVGLAWGTVAGMARPLMDEMMMRTVDAFLSIPRLLLVLTIVSLWPRVTPEALIVVLGLTGWFGISRLARAETVAVRDREFAHAARALGVGTPSFLVKHVIPHAVGPVLVAATIAVSQVIVIEAGLFFLGVVPDAPASWGSVIHDGRDAPVTWWWLTLIPGAFLVAVSLAVNAVASRLRRAINPRQLLAR